MPHKSLNPVAVIEKPCALRLRVVATCVAALLLCSSLTGAGLAQTAPALDTSALPRPPAARQIHASALTTIISTTETVPAAAAATLALLEAAGWQRYRAPFTQYAPQPTQEIHTLKKGGQALSLMVSTAPAQNNATTISYTAVPLERDLPFPAGASGILFSPERLHLDAEAAQTPEALFAYYRKELPASGWTLHSASDGAGGMRIPTSEGLQHGYFTHPGHGALHVSAKAGKDGRSTVAIRSVPASVLPGAQVARAPEPPRSPPAAPSPNAGLHAQASQGIDTMAQDAIRQALQTPPPGAAAGAAAAALAAAQAQARMRAASPPGGSAPAVASAPPVAAAPEPTLERDEINGVPVPKPYSSREQERTTWRVETSATVKAGVASVLAFYRRELGALGWRESGEAKVESSRASLAFATPDGPATLTLEGKGRETRVSLLLRKEVEAKASGMMPRAGMARVMFGSMLDAESTVTIAGRTIKVAAGVGEKTPNGPSIEAPPGVHKVTIRSPGKPTVTETVTVKANEIWGLLLGPGGALPLQMY
jgi:hypothetical protein